jgi:ABC-type lipoprotein release transport system permease subunit
MTAAPGMRDLAHRLLTYEVGAGKTSEPMEFATTLRVYEKLRQSLSAFAGVAAFESLAFRALTQAKSEAPGLWGVQVAEDGSLQGLGKFDPQVGIDKNQTGEDGVILLARLLNLLPIFLGETLTLRLMRDVWPEAAFDDRNSKDGRNA